MNKIVFTEEFCSPENLFPFTLTRQIQDIRIGILTIREKWEQLLGLSSFDKQEEDYKDLDRALVIDEQIGDDVLYLIHGNILPTLKLAKQVKKLKPGEFISIPGQENIVYCITRRQIINKERVRVEKAIKLTAEFREIKYPWDIFGLNGWAIQNDLEWLKKTKKFQTPSTTNKLTKSDNIYVEKGAIVDHCYLNATDGPIYIAKGAKVMEGSMVRGPVAIGEGAIVKMGTKIYGATTIGPYCNVGGEIKNSVLFGYSNKAHDGYIGDAVIGEWCNLGAGTSCSNVKNNASTISVYTPHGLTPVGLKCGVLMGDYSRTAINTSINSGTVVGVSCNVFGTGLTPRYIPSFSWGSEGIERYDLNKALEHIENWKKLKQQTLTTAESVILKHIFEHF